jgi:hypothetical protein
MDKKQDCNSIANELTGIDHLIIKVFIAFVVLFVSFLVILIVYKVAIQRKLIFKLSQYI